MNSSLTSNEKDRIYELANKCIDTNYLISEKNNGTSVILECVPKSVLKKLQSF